MERDWQAVRGKRVYDTEPRVQWVDVELPIRFNIETIIREELRDVVEPDLETMGIGDRTPLLTYTWSS